MLFTMVMGPSEATRPKNFRQPETVMNLNRRHRALLLTEIGEHNQTLRDHKKLASLHIDEPQAFHVAYRLAEIAYNAREAARRELARAR